MRIVGFVALLLSLHASSPATAPSSDSAETDVTAAPGEVVLLPCYAGGNRTQSRTTWLKDGREVVAGAGNPRLAVLHDGTLAISPVTPGDEGGYRCDATLPGGGSFRARVQLQVVGGPDRVSVSIGPATAVSNVTLAVYRGSAVTLNCSARSYPSQRLTWAFEGASSSNGSLASGAAGSWLHYRIEDVQPGDQGVYTCTANNTVSLETAEKSTQLLVYYAPDRHPECTWTPGQDPSHVHFGCTWFGAYPAPTLRWDEDRGPRPGPPAYATEVTDSLTVTLNRSALTDGQTLRCAGRHPALAPPGQESSCSFTLKRPFPEGEPLAAALESASVTLTCTEEASMPPANTTWRRGLRQDAVPPGAKYALSEDGPVLRLTIRNVTRDDEGFYFCRSENPLAVTELEVYLTVKSSSANTGAIIGVFIAALIVGSAAIIAKTLYSSRHRICLGSGFGQIEGERGDVLSLVESDDEQIFQDAVPRLPPVSNGFHTTLVQIHRIPSSDHEDAESADTSPRQQDDTASAEEPVELVTF